MGEKTRVATKRVYLLFARRRTRVIVGVALVTGALVLWGPWTYAIVSTASQRYAGGPARVPTHRVAIVFGARVDGDEPTLYLRYRIDAAAALYKAGRVQKLLMTGDNSRDDYDEPAVMRQTAIDEGVKPTDITVDDAGFSTYDSCYRARHVFGLGDAVLVTQAYHLPRAVFACDGVGVRSVGYAARETEPLLVAEYTVREWLSTDKIVVQLLTHARSKFVGQPLPIR